MCAGKMGTGYFSPVSHLSPRGSPVVEARLRALQGAGDLDAASRLAFEAYGDEVCAFVWSLCEEGDAADEVLAAGWEDFLRGFERFGWSGTCRAWLYGRVRNAFLRYRRSVDPRRRARRVDRAHAAGLARLKEEERTLLYLRVDLRMSWEELSQVFAEDSVPRVATLRRRFDRVRAKLRGR